MILRLLQLGDSALPIGGYSHSWGLEAAIDRGLVADPPGLEAGCAAGSNTPRVRAKESSSRRSAGRSAGQWTIVWEANELLAASLMPPTLRHASRDMGEQLLASRGTVALGGRSDGRLRRSAGLGRGITPSSSRLWPRSAGASPSGRCRYTLHQAALGIIGAGVRAIPIGHTHGQQILARLHDDIARAGGRTARPRSGDRRQRCPAYEVLVMPRADFIPALFRS